VTDTLSKLTTGGRDFVQAVLDTVDSLVLVLDLEGRIVLFNRACERVSGYRFDEVVGRTVWDALLAPDYADAARESFDESIRSGFGNRFVGQWVAKDGALRVVSWTGAGLNDESGELEYVIGSGEDVTERAAAEERYREMFESDLTANYISTPSGQLVACNRTFARLCGFESVDHAIASGATALYVEPGVREGFLELLRDRGRLDRHEIVLRRRDGSEIHAVESAVGTFDEHGKLVQINGFLYDDTKHKRLEEQYQQAQKMEAIGRLAGGIAHDFNNVLTVISGYGEFLSRRLPESDPLREDVEQIRKATKKASDLTRQLLAFSRKQVMRPKPIEEKYVEYHM
jgi:PAS domain S-box-containing protein